MKNLIVSIVSCMIGILIAHFFMTFQTGEMNLRFIGLSFLLIVGIQTSIYIYSVFYKKKNGEIPIEDERSKLLIRKFMLNTFILLLFGSLFILPIIYYVVGVTVISMKTLILFSYGLFIFITFGTIIVKRL